MWLLEIAAVRAVPCAELALVRFPSKALDVDFHHLLCRANCIVHNVLLRLIPRRIVSFGGRDALVPEEF